MVGKSTLYDVLPGASRVRAPGTLNSILGVGRDLDLYNTSRYKLWEEWEQ